MDFLRRRSLTLADIHIDDHELIDSLTDIERSALLLEIYNDAPDDLMKHAEIGIKIMMGSDAVLPPAYWWLEPAPDHKPTVVQ